MNKKSQKFIIKKGFSLVEIILAVALFGIFATAFISLLINAYGSNFQASEKDKAALYAKQGMEAVWSIRRQAWNLLANGDYGLTSTNGYWEFSGSSELLEDKYTRIINIADACRDIAGDIVECTEPGATVDLHTKKATVNVGYTAITGFNNNIELVGYLTTWQSQDWQQSNWIGGSGQSAWFDVTRYYADDGNIDYSVAGQISLLSSGSAGPTIYIWPFDTPGNYTYETEKIEVTGGVARLIEDSSGSGGILDGDFEYVSETSYDWPFDMPVNYVYDSEEIEVLGSLARLKMAGGTTVSGDTANPYFSTSTDEWSYNDWDQGGGEENVTGSYNSSGGNPDGWIDVYLPWGRNDEFGGFWAQPFTVSVADATAVVSFDWQVSQLFFAFNTFKAYVFVDSSSGEPVIGQEVWSSDEISEVQDWASVTGIDVSSKISSPGTYYIKVATWAESGGGWFGGGYGEVGFDNVNLTWEKTTGGTYPTDEPDIYLVNSYAGGGILSWDSFSETATKNGGEIYYQLSDDNGLTWKYWDSSDWAAAGTSDYNTASIINSSISDFPITTEGIKFKAFLESDGNQLVQLENINLGLTPPSAVWSFSDYGVGGGEVTPTGTKQSSGGNPDYYAEITVPQGKNDEIGGYWEQEFTTTENDPSFDIDFDYKSVDFNLTPNVAEIRVYVDSSSGPPSNQVGSSISVNGEGSWTSATTIDASSAVTTAGTYYLKLAYWIESPGGSGAGPFTVGFDNVSAGWSDDPYASDQPTIFPTDSWEPDNVDKWKSFAATSTAPGGGEVYYQLWDGAAWQWWDGNNWINASVDPLATDYNTATEINDNIFDFSATSGEINFKAFLAGDGTQEIELDEVKIEVLTEPPLEIATTTADGNWQTINLQNEYTNPVVIVSYYEVNNGSPISARVRNAGTNSFQVRLEAPNGSTPTTDDIAYLVIEEGEWVFGDIKIEAHLYETSTLGRKNNWNADSMTYQFSYDNDPLVFHQLMSNNDTSWVTTWISRDGSQSNPPDADGFQMALNCAEACTSHSASETIGWVAVERDVSGTVEGITFETQRTSDSVRGHGNGCYNFNFDNSYSFSPIVIASQLEMDGGDGSWSVICNIDDSQAGFHAEEDTISDTERNHTTETFGFMAFYQNPYSEKLRISSFGSGYATSGWLESSAFDTTGPSAFNFISWTETLPSANEDIQVQIATAPDSGGSPGIWTDWMGPTGSGIYFTSGDEVLLPLSNGHNDDQWVKYRVEFTGDGSDTPILQDITVNYTR